MKKMYFTALTAAMLALVAGSDYAADADRTTETEQEKKTTTTTTTTTATTVITETVRTKAKEKPAWKPFKVCVLDFTSIDINGQVRFLDTKNNLIVIPPQNTLNDADHRTINSIMQGYVRMIDAWDNSCDILAENAYKGPFLRMVEELNAFVKVGIASPHSVRVSALQEETRYRYPDWSIRELLLNSIIHRDYEIGNAPIKFYDYGGRIEISNPGGLYGQATPENFPYVSDYRNPLLAEAMKVMGYVNKFNRGITKVKAEMAANGNPVPIFDVNKRTEFRVTLRPADSAFDERNGNRNGSQNEQKTLVDSQNGNRNGNRNDKQKIVDVISRYPGIQRKELSQKTGILLRKLDRLLKELKSGNGDFPQIEHRGADKTGGWFIKS